MTKKPNPEVAGEVLGSSKPEPTAAPAPEPAVDYGTSGNDPVEEAMLEHGADPEPEPEYGGEDLARHDPRARSQDTRLGRRLGYHRIEYGFVLVLRELRALRAEFEALAAKKG